MVDANLLVERFASPDRLPLSNDDVAELERLVDRFADGACVRPNLAEAPFVGADDDTRAEIRDEIETRTQRRPAERGWGAGEEQSGAERRGEQN